MSALHHIPNRTKTLPPLRVGIGGPVGSGKTTLLEMLCKAMRERYDLIAITNDIYTKEDQRLLTISGALPAERIMGVETGGCPHTAIREDASINLEAIDRMLEQFPNADVVFVESGGDNLAATFSPELSDLTIYVIDVAAGEKIPRKGGPGITKSDLFVINKTDLAPHVGANLDVMEADTQRMRGAKPYVMTNLKTPERLGSGGQLHRRQGHAGGVSLVESWTITGLSSLFAGPAHPATSHTLVQLRLSMQDLTSPKISVEKIGGTSMSAFGDVLRHIMLHDPARIYGRIYVVSAYSGVTNQLLEHKKTGERGIYARFAEGTGYQEAPDWLGRQPEKAQRRFCRSGLAAGRGRWLCRCPHRPGRQVPERHAACAGQWLPEPQGRAAGRARSAGLDRRVAQRLQLGRNPQGQRRESHLAGSGRV